MKVLMSALLLLAVGLVPAGSVPETPVPPACGGAVLSFTVTIAAEAGGTAPTDEGMLLEPDASVDPDMLIVCGSGLRPGFYHRPACHIQHPITP